MADVQWRHKKTGNMYRIVRFGIIEKTLSPAVIYEPLEEPGALFVRPCEEFFDGRFVMVDTTPRREAKSVPPAGPVEMDEETKYTNPAGP